MIQKEKMRNEQETISIEEYLNRRRKIREKEKRRRHGGKIDEKNSAWTMAEFLIT